MTRCPRYSDFYFFAKLANQGFHTFNKLLPRRCYLQNQEIRLQIAGDNVLTKHSCGPNADECATDRKPV